MSEAEGGGGRGGGRGGGGRRVREKEEWRQKRALRFALSFVNKPFRRLAHTSTSLSGLAH